VSPFRILVCDDEPIAVSRLAGLLSRIPDAKVVGTAIDGPTALEAVGATRPDLLLLDIEMPGPDGFDVVRSVEDLVRDGHRPAPLIAFVTAYRRLAPEAFDSGVVDFLTKPVRLERLEQCIAKARRLASARNAEIRLAALESAAGTNNAAGTVEAPHVWVQRRGELVKVDLETIERLSADGPYVRLHTSGASYLHRASISQLEERLAPLAHMRVHRSHIVAIAQVARIRRTVHGGAELVLRDGTQIPVGRSYAKEVRRKLLHLDECA